MDQDFNVPQTPAVWPPPPTDFSPLPPETLPVAALGNFRVQSVWLVLFLTVITLGIYAVFWLRRQNATLNLVRPDLKVVLLYGNIVLAVAFLSAGLDVASLINDAQALDTASNAVGRIFSIMVLILSFQVRNGLNILMQAQRGDTFWFSGVYTWLLVCCISNTSSTKLFGAGRPSYGRLSLDKTCYDCESSPNARLARAALSLDGLSVGDAFGERYFTSGADELIAARTLAYPPWHYTDDTQMALSVISVLRQFGKIDQDALATNFSVHYEEERGYGDAMNRLVPMIYLTGMWRMMAPRLFSGEGSLGNGAAMRVAPLGAYFADDLALAAAQAALSAEVTHAHPEGIAGAIAVAVAAASAARLRGLALPTCADFLAAVLPHIPSGLVADGLRRAAALPPETTVREAARLLGCGYNATAPDTVPFALWCAGQHLGNYEEALWLTASGMGDIDTNCAIVGGIVALSAGAASIPDAWIAAREPLPRWPFQETSEN